MAPDNLVRRFAGESFSADSLIDMTPVLYYGGVRDTACQSARRHRLGDPDHPDSVRRLVRASHLRAAVRPSRRGRSHDPAASILPIRKKRVSRIPPVPLTKRDTRENPTQSTLQLYGDNRPMGPAHSTFRDISLQGRGRFAYLADGDAGILVFSASDNSDPNTNGRVYRVVDPNARDPYPRLR